MLVDTLGLIWGLVVLPADIQDRDGAKTLLQRVHKLLPRLQVIWADGAYAAIAGWLQDTFGWLLTTILRPVGGKGTSTYRAAGSSSGPSVGSGVTDG